MKTILINALMISLKIAKIINCQVKDACLEYVQPVVGKVKPVVTYAQDVVTNSKRKVHHIFFLILRKNSLIFKWTVLDKSKHTFILHLNIINCIFQICETYCLNFKK